MPFTSYPDAAVVENLIRSAGYWPTDATKQELASIQAAIGAQAAQDEWEHLTGWAPFLAGLAFTERAFDGTDHTGFLDFGGGAVAIESVSGAGPTPIPEAAFRFEPRNAPSQHLPITGIQLRGGQRSQISVKARWGCRADVPGDVYQAILQKAALIVLTQIENLQSIASLSQDGFTKAYDTVGIVTQKDLASGGAGGGGLWGSNFKAIAARYRRVIC